MKISSIIQQYRADPKLFIEKFLHIETTEQRIQTLLGVNLPRIRGEIYPFRFCQEQQFLYECYQKQRKQKKPIRIVVLKSRQITSTTFWLSLLFATTILNPNRKSLVITNRDEIKAECFAKISLFYNDLPELLKVETSQFSIIRGIVFNNKRGTGLRSEIKFDVSANKDAGAGTTKHFVLLTEVARFLFPEKIMLSVSSTVPSEPETTIILESTARGYGNYFHQLWERAKSGKTEYEAVFFPWFFHKYFYKPLDEEWYDIPLDSDSRYYPEKELKKKYNLTDEQLYWRRYTIDNKCNGDPIYFGQEYPSNDAEAFVSTAVSVFNARKLQSLYLLCSDGQKGFIKNNTFSPSLYGNWTLWEKPIPGVSYIFGIDSGTGIAQGDPNVIVVLRGDTLDQVAEFYSHQEASEFATEIINGATYFNNAFLVPEITGSGLAVLSHLKSQRYYNIYHWEKTTDVGKVITSKMGFEVTNSSKHLLISYIREYLANDIGRIRSSELIREMMSYVELPSGKIGGKKGCYDDRVIALGLALIGRYSGQRSFLKKTEPEQKILERPLNKGMIVVPFIRHSQLIEEGTTTLYGDF